MTEACLTSGSESFEHHLVSMAGGHNIFAHVKDNYFYVEWDEVIRYNPQVILIHQYKRKDLQKGGWPGYQLAV